MREDQLIWPNLMVVRLTATRSLIPILGQARDGRAPHDDRVCGNRRRPRPRRARHGGAGVRLRRADHSQEATRGQGTDAVEYCFDTFTHTLYLWIRRIEHRK